MNRVLPAVLLVVLSLGVSLAAAHLKMDKASPAEGATITAAPAQIRIWFTEGPTLAVSRITLTGPSGKIELGTLALGTTNDMPDHSLQADVKGAIPPGVYAVAWKTSGKDGHMLAGVYEFKLQTR